jgi:hypothetical protein
MATLTTRVKHKSLPTAEKLNSISKVDGTPDAPCIETAEELGIPVTTYNTSVLNRKKIIEQSRSVQLDKKKKNSKI